MIVKTRHGAFQRKAQKSNKFKRQQEQQLQRILGQRLYNRVMARFNESPTTISTARFNQKFNKIKRQQKQ
ncbi:MAG: hypothetical protein J5588_01490 [Bacteroidales bacterium]|nr:hypothetical protein [Bacteroidales bacterium]